jgi:hypothetical protein
MEANTRKELEDSVISTNIHLRRDVKTMDIKQLLRNVHPNYRSDFAFRLMKENKLTKSEAGEFTITI